MIKTFKHKGLKELFEKGNSRKIDPQALRKCLRRMEMLDVAESPEDMGISGLKFHRLSGNPKRYSIWVTGNYRITFGWDGKNAIKVDYEDYH